MTPPEQFESRIRLEQIAPVIRYVTASDVDRIHAQRVAGAAAKLKEKSMGKLADLYVGQAVRP